MYPPLLGSGKQLREYVPEPIPEPKRKIPLRLRSMMSRAVRWQTEFKATGGHRVRSEMCH